MPPVGFEPTVSAGERPQTYALESAATGTGSVITLRFERKAETRLVLFIVYSWVRHSADS